MRTIGAFVIMSFLFQGLFAQSNLVEISGSIIVKNNSEVNPKPGTIRWNGLDFQGWNGQIWVSLSGNTEVGFMIDIDNNAYGTVRIGNQTWSTENLKTTRYNDGTNIIDGTDEDIWKMTNQGAWAIYNDDISIDDEYGKLYNWYAVASGKLCPSGWSVPSRNDYNELIDFLFGQDEAGGLLKEVGTSHWSFPNIDATNDKGFSARGGGFRTDMASYNQIEEFAVFWTRESAGANAYARRIIHNSASMDELLTLKKTGQSVRCIKN